MSTVTDYREIYSPPEPMSFVKTCPCCETHCRNTDSRKPFGINDRYGFRLWVTQCHRCDLKYIYARIHAKAYADFYQSGAYRRLVSAYHGREMRGGEQKYNEELWAFLAIPLGRHMSCLDIGGADGGHWPSAELVDPALNGITAETFDPAGRQWDLITVCQTVDHLLEPGAVFKKLAGCLAPSGVLFFDAVDFDATKEYKIDHPCNFNMRSAVMLAHVAGLRIDKMERSGNHLRFLCRHW